MTTTPTKKPALAYKGKALLASEWNLIRELVLDTIRQQRGNGFPLESHLPAAAVMFRLKSSNGNYWTARRYDGTTEQTEDVLIAKPWELRPSVTTIGSQTYSYTNDALRTATEGANNETQVVVPAWTVNETVLWACRARNTGVVDGNGDALGWLDLNVAARAWAKQAE